MAYLVQNTRVVATKGRGFYRGSEYGCSHGCSPIQWHMEAEITHGPNGIRMSFTSVAELRSQAILRIPLSQGTWLYGCVLVHAQCSLIVSKSSRGGNTHSSRSPQLIQQLWSVFN